VRIVVPLVHVAHFIRLGIDLSRHRALGPAGQPIRTVVKDSLNETLSITLLIDLSNPENPFGLSMHTDSNTHSGISEFL
jgi:hypothetical protein